MYPVHCLLFTYPYIFRGQHIFKATHTHICKHMHIQQHTHIPLRAPSSPPDTPIPIYNTPFSFTRSIRRSVFLYLYMEKRGGEKGWRETVHRRVYTRVYSGQTTVSAQPRVEVKYTHTYPPTHIPTHTHTHPPTHHTPYTHHSFPPSMMMSPGSMNCSSASMVESTGAPALTRITTRLC